MCYLVFVLQRVKIVVTFITRKKKQNFLLKIWKHEIECSPGRGPSSTCCVSLVNQRLVEPVSCSKKKKKKWSFGDRQWNNGGGMKRSLDTSPLKPDSHHPYTLPRARTEAGTCSGPGNSVSVSLFGDWVTDYSLVRGIDSSDQWEGVFPDPRG